MSKVIKNTGDLRATIAETLVQVQAGRIKQEDARMIHKLAHAINDSFFAEAKMMQLQADLKQPLGYIGDLPLRADQSESLARAA